MVVAQWLKVLLLFYLAGVGSNHCGSICDFESLEIFDSRDLGSIPAQVRRKFSISRFARPGFDPAARTGPISDVIS